MKKALLILGIAIALALSGCSAFYGEDGTATLTVQVGDSYYDGLYAIADSDLGWGAWSTDTAYPVTNGTYTFDYNVARYTRTASSYSGYYYYYYYANGYSTSSYMYGPYGPYSSMPYTLWTIGKAAYAEGYYLSTSVTIEVNEGTLFQDGEDRDYVLTFNYYTSPTISGNSVALASQVNTADKSVKVFTSAHDKITLTTTKVAVGDMSLGKSLELQSVGASVSNEVQENGAKASPQL